MAKIDSYKPSVVNGANGNGQRTRIGNYEIIGTIGHGNFAICKLAQHTLTKTLVAIKFIDKTNLDAAHLKRLNREIQIMKSLDHPNIIKLYQVMESRNMLFLVCEYATNGEIFEYISRRGKMSETMACEKFSQIISAVEYCHKRNIVHRDLKSENLLLDADMNIKLADFGFANYYDMVNPLQTFCGSPPYAAPEVFSGQQYFGPEIDIWSLGVILFVLVTGTLPFNSDNLQQLKQKVLMGKFTVPYFVSKECENLIRNMLLVDPRRRFTLEQVKRHPWLRLAHMSCLNNQYGAIQCNYESSNSNLHKSIINSAESNASSKKVNSIMPKKSYSLSNLATTTRNMNYYKVIPKTIETTKENTTQFNNKHILYDPCCIVKNLKEIAKSNRSTRLRSQSFNSISDLIFKTNNQSIDRSSNGKKASFKRNKKAIKSYDEESTNSYRNFESFKESDEKLYDSNQHSSSGCLLSTYNKNSYNNYTPSANTSVTKSRDIEFELSKMKDNMSRRAFATSHYCRNNRILKKFISHSLSVDEGVESDLSSPANSNTFSNDLLASSMHNASSTATIPSSQHLFMHQLHEQQKLINLNKSSALRSQEWQEAQTAPSSSTSSNISLASYRSQASTHNYMNKKNNSMNQSKNSFNPYDVAQIKRELKNLIKKNSNLSISPSARSNFGKRALRYQVTSSTNSFLAKYGKKQALNMNSPTKSVLSKKTRNLFNSQSLSDVFDRCLKKSEIKFRKYSLK